MILSRRVRPLVTMMDFGGRLIHTTPVVEKKMPHVWVHIENHEFHKVIQYVRPEEVKPWDPRRSCDLRAQEEIDPNWLKLEFRPFAEMIDELPEEHRRLFTVGFGPRREGTQVLLQDSFAKTQRHRYDYSSLDFKITWSTWKIRNLQNLFENYPNIKRMGHIRSSLASLIAKRKKWMGQMRRADYKRFEWIIEVLGLLYKLNPPETRIERKASINVLVNMYCNQLRDQKMSEYKAQLEEEKVPFLKMKLETLQSIRADEQSVNLESSVDDDIRSTRKLLMELEKSHLTIHPVPDTERIESTKASKAIDKS